MKITLSLQPGNKVQIPLEIPDEELKALTVLNLKEKRLSLFNLGHFAETIDWFIFYIDFETMKSLHQKTIKCHEKRQR